MTLSTENGSVPCLYLSFDFELAWGVIENELWKSREQLGVYTRMHEGFQKLVNFLEDREVAVDWATVGAMFDDPEQYELEHLPAIYYDKVRSFLDLAGSESMDGRFLIDVLLASRNQKLSAHGYTHLVFDRPYATASAITTELLLVSKRLNAVGGSSSLIVFPENRPCDEDLLVKNGFSITRDPIPAGRSRLSNVVRPHPARWVVSGRGVRSLSGTALFRAREGKSIDYIALSVIRRRCLEILCGGGSVCLWLHPFNLYQSQKALRFFMDSIDLFARARDAGKFRFSSMTDSID